MTTLFELVESAIEKLEEWANDNIGSDPDEIAFSIADNHVPVYTSSLLELALDDLDLAITEPEIGPAFDGSSTPANIIAANVFDYIRNALYEAWDDIEKEIALAEEEKIP